MRHAIEDPKTTPTFFATLQKEMGKALDQQTENDNISKFVFDEMIKESAIHFSM